MKTKRAAADWVMEAIALAALLGMVVLLLDQWQQVPEKVPIHFSASGAANRWGSKDSLWLLPLLGGVVYLLLTFTAKNPYFMNVPIQIDRENPVVRSLLLRMSITLKAAILLTFLGIIWFSIDTALGKSEGLGAWFLPSTLVVICGPMIGFLVRLNRIC